MASENLPHRTDNLRTIFVDSNINTHLAMVVSLHDTISDVRAKIAAEHALCFQDIGEIDIQAIKVRRRGFFYNLTDSMRVLNVFDGVQRSCFLCIDIVPMCAVKIQKALPNEVTNELLKRPDYAVPVRSVDKHQEIVLGLLSPKNLDPDGQESHNPSINHGHRPTILIDQEKDDRKKDDCKNRGTKASDAMPSATCTNKTISSKRRKKSHQDKLLEIQSEHYLVEKKRGKKLKDGLHEEHLEVCRRGEKFMSREDIDESNKSTNILQEINSDGKKEFPVTSEGLLMKLPHENAISLQNSPSKKQTKKTKIKSSKSHEVSHLVMSSEIAVRSSQVITDPQGMGKEVNASMFSEKYLTEPNIEELLPTNVLQEINSDGKKEFPATSEGLLMKFPHENTISLQNSPSKKQTKKRKTKSSKSHEMSHLVMSSEIAVVRSSQVITDPQSMGKEVNASMFSEKYPTEPNIEELLPTNVLQEIISDGKKEFPATSEGLLMKLPHEDTFSLQNSPSKKQTKKRKTKSSKSHEVSHLVMSSEIAVVRSPQVITDPQSMGKEVNASMFSEKCPTEPNIEELLPNDQSDMSATHNTASFMEVANQKETKHSLEGNKEPIEDQILQVTLEDRSQMHVNLSQYTTSLMEHAEAKISSQVVSEFSTKLHSNTEGLPSKLPHENTISLQNPLVEKHTKKRKRKSSKSHEEAHFVKSYGSVVVRSPQLTTDSHNSMKETGDSIFSGKYPSEPSIKESFAIGERDMNTSLDIARFLEVVNQKESSHSMKISEVPFEEHILQVNHEDQTEKHGNSDQDTNANVNFEEPESRVSSQLASESKIKIYCSTDKFKNQSSKISESKEANDQESRESDATKSITDLNLGEAGYVDVKAGISTSAEKFPYHEQDSNVVSNLKGANKNNIFTKADSKGLSKSQRTRKKSKADSSRVSESIEVNGNEDHFNSDNAQVSLNDAQNEPNAAKLIKQAEQKANWGHSVDTSKVSSSSKKGPNEEEISNMKPSNPSTIIPNNLNEVPNAFFEQAAEIRVPSQTSSEVQAKPRRSRRNSKCEPPKLGSQENSDVVLLKFNGVVTESNDERGSDPSKLANEANHKKDLHCMDAGVKVPMSDENSSKLVKVPQVNPSESPSCKLQDLSEQSNAEIIIKGHVSQFVPMAGPTKSKRDGKKSKKETLKSQVSSEMSESAGLCRPEDSTIKFDDLFVPKEGKHSPAVHAADPPGKSESRKKNKTSRKTDINQSNQDSPTYLVQPSSYKQHLAIVQPLENDTNHGTVDDVHDTVTKDSKTGIERKAKHTKQSSKQNSLFGIIESESSLITAHDKHMLNKKLHAHEPESPVQLSKSGDMGNEQGKKIATDDKGKTRLLAPNHDIDNMVSKDGVRKDLNSSTISNPAGDAVGSNNFDVSQIEVMATEVTSRESTEDTPYQQRRYRVVRKIPIRKSKERTNNSSHEKSLLVSSGRIFSDASATSSESDNDPYKKKASIKSALEDLSISPGSESQLEKVQTKASSLKLPMDTNCFGTELDERGEISKKADDGRTKNHSRSDASAQKIPLSSILKSSISYKKSKLTASQSEFPEAESQPMDVVLETQPESAAP